MHKDVRYKLVGTLIINGNITQFSQVFDLVPKSVWARSLHKNTNRMDELIAHPELLRYKDLKNISALLEVPCSMVIKLFDKEFS